MRDGLELPLGEEEDQRREFLPASAAEDPVRVGRHVVAMLNADGGEIWVGVAETDGRAVDVDRVHGGDRSARELHDLLMDRVVPNLSAEDLEVRWIPADEERESARGLLLIRVRSGAERSPYAWVEGDQWTFPVRSGARLRPLAWGEIFDSADHRPLRRLRSRMSGERTALQQLGDPLLWLALQVHPSAPLEITPEQLELFLTEPERSGNRRSGWSFLRTVEPPRREGGKIVWGVDPPGRYRLRGEIDEEGSGRFIAGIRMVERDGVLSPLALLELPTSAFRLLAAIEAEHLSAPETQVLADLALLSIGPAVLEPPAGDLGIAGTPVQLVSGDDAISEGPLLFQGREVVAAPDRCAFRLVRRIYRAFGLAEDSCPVQYDRGRGRLVLED